MVLDVGTLESKEGQLVTVEEELEVDSIDFHQDSLPFLEPITLTGKAIYQDEVIHLELEINTKIQQHCRRCLSPIDATIDRRESLEFRPEIQYEVSSEGDLSIYKYQGEEEIDLRPYVLSFLRLDMEPYPLCKPDCEGLCPDCGADLNENPEHDCTEEPETEAKDPRMEKLAELL